ncbi:hypothetical protein P3T76_004906 [Phytophthora citrophthora]|uniref:Uncharacterized protein n=1 Tax=Phytophthora citrophthora TaxID=4793 RepID=A0AAD9GRR2_9STRA|nr:hypothetical protein P3T76_004906 [Phytophthora citrophthora]
MDVTTQVALAVLCGLVALVIVSKVTSAIRGGSSIFLQFLLNGLVIVQFYYLFQASRHQLQ